MPLLQSPYTTIKNIPERYKKKFKVCDIGRIVLFLENYSIKTYSHKANKLWNIYI